MLGIPLLHAVWLFLCLLIVLFYLLRLIGSHRWLHHVDIENEVGHGGMCYMFLLMGSSMSPPARYVNCLFLAIFAFLTFFYARETSKDLR